MIIDIETLFAISCLHPHNTYNVYFFLDDMNTCPRYLENVDGIKAITFIERIFGTLGVFEVELTANYDNRFECIRPDIHHDEIAGVVVLQA